MIITLPPPIRFKMIRARTAEKVIQLIRKRKDEMKRYEIVMILVGLFGPLSLAQESETRAPEQPEPEYREQRGVIKGRRQYLKKEVGVKDPDHFKAEGKAVFSGPQPGEKVSAIKVVGLIGEEKGKEFDPIAAAGDKPHVLFFQDESGVAIRGLFGIGRAIGTINRQSGKDLKISCVFLADDPDKINSSFGQLFSRMREQGIDVVAVSTDGRDGPGSYGLNRTIAQTIILAKEGKVTRNFVFRQGMLLPDPHVMGGIAELIDEDRETVAGWLAANDEAAGMQMRGRRGDDAGNDPQATEKAALGEKVREFVRAGKLTRAEAGEIIRAAFPERQ